MIPSDDIRRIVKEEIRKGVHGDLRYMPDIPANNRDHDSRYYAKYQYIHLQSNAAVYDDQQVVVSSVRLPAVSAPTWTAYKGSEVLTFSKSATNIVHFAAQLSHSYQEGSNISFHIHYVAPDTGVGNVRWTFTRSWAGINGVFPAETTTTIDVAAPTVADKHTYAVIESDISGSGKTISSVLLCSLSRIGGNAADTYDNVIYLIAMDFHIKMDSIGSRSVGTK